MRRTLSGLLLFLGLFLMCADSVGIVIAGLAIFATGAISGGAFQKKENCAR